MITKNKNPKRLLIGFLLTIFLTACIKDFSNLADTLSENLTFEISTDLLKNIASIQFLDSETNTPIKKVSIQIAESEFEELYTLAGDADLAPVNGLLLIGIRKTLYEAQGSAKKLVLNISADGYYPIQQEFLIDTSLLNAVVSLESMRDNPAILEDDYTFTKAEMAIDLSLDDKVKIHFDPNAQFMDEQGKEVKQINAEIDYYAGTRANKLYFEDILSDVSYFTNEGAKEKIMINPAAIIDVNLNSQGKYISGFTYPAAVSVAIDQDMYNPLEKRKIQVGDRIASFYWDEMESAWRAEGFAIIIEEGGQFFANLSVTHFSRWVIGWSNRSAIANMEEECHVFIRLIGDTPDTIRGTAIIDGVEVKYEYTQRPEYRFYQIFPGCMSGQGFSLGKIIGEARMEAEYYFKMSNPELFKDLEFTEEVQVSVQDSPERCNKDEKRYLLLNMIAQYKGTGILNYVYGRVNGSRTINLEEGKNTIMLPIPLGALNSWLFGDGSFSFTFENECELRTAISRIPLCDVPFGVNLAINNAAPATPLMTNIEISGTCQDTEGNYKVSPTIPLFYRPSCMSRYAPFSFLGMIDNGILEGTLPISVGETYDFRVQLGNETHQYDEVEVPNGTATFTVDEHMLTLDFTGDRLEFKFVDFRLPESICSLVD